MSVQYWHKVAAIVACMGMLIPTTVFAERPTTMLTDIALGEGGLLVGQVVDTQGVAKPGAQIAVLYRDQEIVRTVSDENGVFAAQGLRGGVYVISTEQGSSGIRAWAPDTAPPSAQSTSVVVAGDDVVRGNLVTDYIPGGTMGLAIGAAAAVAIGIGIAVAEDGDGS